MLRWKSLATLAVTVALTATACSSGGTDAGGGSNPTGGAAHAPLLRLGVAGAPTTMAASGSSIGQFSPFYQAVYDSLIRAKPDGTLAPMLAESWTYDDARTRLTLKLRKGVTFTDGTAFNAAAAKANLERFTKDNPERQLLAAVKTLTAPDEATLVIGLKEVDPGLLDALAGNASFMQSPATFDAKDAATRPVGSGPYTLDTSGTVIGSKYTFTANPKYWDKSLVHYDKISMSVFTDGTAQVNAVKSGQLDAAALTTNQKLADIKAAGWTALPQPLDMSGIFIYDRAGKINPALGKVEVRRAMNHAFDRAALLKAVSQGLGEVSAQPYGTTSVAYDKSLNDLYSYDPAKSKAMLAEAGYPDGVKIELPTTNASSPLFTFIKQQLDKAGFHTKLVDAGTKYVTDIMAGKYALAFFQVANTNDWTFTNAALTEGALWNPLHYKDATSVKLIDQVRNEEGSAQDKALKDLNAHVTKDAWFAPWYQVQNVFTAGPKTSVELQKGQAFPGIWYFTPKS
ncbi:ABC transporter substrate-binding protein [Streptomyces sp. NPDC002932]|uniref:ABC transporter substrate-binding protein n=1 Tax=Streptomyces sp. NPDC002932 TaxID=3364672 RepID=UPI0036AC8DB2